MISSGKAQLPLHYGRVPSWLYERMEKIGTSITELLLEEHGSKGFLSRISNPYWFQALGCVMGMDWHSSGITTSVLGALKRGINKNSATFGLHICGGRGKQSRNTPNELVRISGQFGIESEGLVHASRLSAKIDNTCINDGYQLYLHTCIVDRDGNWSVVQQGMNTAEKMARRYHWHSSQVTSFVDNPHSAVVGPNRGVIMNMVDTRAAASRDAVIDFISQSPGRQHRELAALGLCNPPTGQLDLFMPAEHEVGSQDVDAGRLGAVLALAHSRGAREFTDTLLTPGVGPRTVQALALVSEVVYGKPNRFSDPARFSFAHGGKDGHPFPVPIKTYDESINTLSRAVRKAKLGNDGEKSALKRLSELAKELEDNYAPSADIQQTIAHERRISSSLGGKTCFN
ncbi:MAG: DUF763 domain-containing protein [Spirochaetota bacterium]